MTVKTPPMKPGRGRPRSAVAREAALRAARSLIEESGVTAVTMEAVAARAGVGKPTLYRSWPNAQALAMAALMHAEQPSPPALGDKSPIDAQRAQVQDLARRFASRAGRGAAVLVAMAEGETELSKAFRHHVILSSREGGRRLLEEASARGLLRDGLDLEVALDLIYGPLFFRLLLGRRPLDAAFAAEVFDQAMQGLRRQA